MRKTKAEPADRLAPRFARSRFLLRDFTEEKRGPRARLSLFATRRAVLEQLGSHA
jgi:hypothetical protein